MQKNELIRIKNIILRVLDVKEDSILVIDCIKRTMPKWIPVNTILDYDFCSESELSSVSGVNLADVESLDMVSRKFIYEHYTLIAGILPFVSDEKLRTEVIDRVSKIMV